MLGAGPQEPPGKIGRKGIQIEQQVTSPKTIVYEVFLYLFGNAYQFIVINYTIFPQMGLKFLKTVVLDKDTHKGTK